MTYGNIPFPDLPSLPIYLSENPNPRRRYHAPQPEVPLEPREVLRRQHAQPSTSEDDDDDGRRDGYDEDKLNPQLRISSLLYSYDDPERTSFFLPLMILLVVHALFLVYIHVYAPSQTEQISKEVKSPFLEYSLNSRRYYDVDGLRNKVQIY